MKSRKVLLFVDERSGRKEEEKEKKIGPFRIFTEVFCH